MILSGVSAVPIDWLTDDGYDMTFGTNVIGQVPRLSYCPSQLNPRRSGHFLFTQLLLPALLAGKETSADKFARVIWLSSYTAYMGPLRYNTFKDGPARKKAGYGLMYFQSKYVSVPNCVPSCSTLITSLGGSCSSP